MNSIKIILLIFVLKLGAAQAQFKPVEIDATNNLNPDNAALLLIDHQAGLLLSTQTLSADQLRNNTLALAKLGKVFSLPVVLTTSGGKGPNGPLLQDITSMYPDVPVVDRTLYFDCMLDPAFNGAVKKTGRKKLIMAGITTDYCLALPAITARKMGYDVYAVVDASGAWSKQIEEVAIARMQAEGVHVVTWAAVLAELQSNLALINVDRAKANQPNIVNILNTHVAPVNFMISSMGGFQLPAAEAAMSDQDKNKEIIRQYYKAFSAGDLKAAEALIDKDYNDHRTGKTGISSLKEYIIEQRKIFPDLDLYIDNMVADKNLVMVYGGIRGTNKGKIGNMAPTGKKVDAKAFQLYRFENGKPVEHWEVADVAGLQQQLGLIKN